MQSLENQKSVKCKTESEAAPGFGTATEPYPPHPILQKLFPAKMNESCKAIIDGSMKEVYKNNYGEPDIHGFSQFP